MGFGNNSIIERVHMKFCKLLLKVKKSTPDFMIYGELGRYPLEVSIKLRIINYWFKLVTGKPDKLSVILYNFAIAKHDTNILWLRHVKSILDNCGWSYVWNNIFFVNKTWLHETVKQNLIDQFKQNWLATLQISPKALNYRLYKDTLECERYFSILDDKQIYLLLKFRTLNMKLPIETGRWQNLERENRKCSLCDSNDIGDEYHYIFNCSVFNDCRKQCIKFHYRNRPVKFHDLMNSKSCSKLNKLCKLIKEINNKLKSSG